MNIALWIVQVLLAVVFVAHGWLLLAPPADLADEINAVFPQWFRLFLGTAEVLAGIGLTVPGIVRIFPSLVAWAAVGITLVMVPATIFHIVRSEFSSAAITAVLFVMATFVAYMRFRVLPIPSRHAVPVGSRART